MEKGGEGGGEKVEGGGMCLGFPVPSFLSRLSFTYAKRKLCSYYNSSLHNFS